MVSGVPPCLTACVSSCAKEAPWYGYRGGGLRAKSTVQVVMQRSALVWNHAISFVVYHQPTPRIPGIALSVVRTVYSDKR
jgi:hypothetical protein